MTKDELLQRLLFVQQELIASTTMETAIIDRAIALLGHGMGASHPDWMAVREDFRRMGELRYLLQVVEMRIRGELARLSK